MTRKKLLQVCLLGVTLAWAAGLRAEGESQEQTVNLRESPARATTPQNVKVVEDFRANGGRPGLLLLHTTGAKTGKPRLTPLAYMPAGDDLVVIASFAGAPKNPAWYHNLVANPRVGVELGTEQFYATARVAEEPERTALFEKMSARSPAFSKFQKKAEPRVIPVIVLSRAP